MGGRIILINGTSSSGTSTLAHALQRALPEVLRDRAAASTEATSER